MKQQLKESPVRRELRLARENNRREWQEARKEARNRKMGLIRRFT